MVEKLSKYIHEQVWMRWTKGLINDGHISEEKKKIWQSLHVPYEQLSEEEKDKDREIAKGILNIISEGRTDHHGYSIRVYP